MREYHPPLGGRNALRLDFNENTVACSPRVQEALGRMAAGELTRYPERAPAEAAVAAHLGLEAAQVLLTNGVDEAIHVLFATYLDAGDELLLPVPTYTMYEVYASQTEAAVRTVAAGEDFRFPFEGLLAALTPRTRLIVVANPNSPTGSVATRAQILALAEAAPQALLLVDEAYFHFFGETVIDCIGRLPNLVVARTFSKAYGLAGLRLGVVAAGAGVLGWCRRVISPYSVNSLALAAIAPALADGEYLEGYVAEVKAARQEFLARLRGQGIRHWPTQANFVLVRVGPGHAEFSAAMKARGVLVRDRSSDPGCEGCVRITIGTREQMRLAWQAMAEMLPGKGAAAEAGMAAGGRP